MPRKVLRGAIGRSLGCARLMPSLPKADALSALRAFVPLLTIALNFMQVQFYGC